MMRIKIGPSGIGGVKEAPKVLEKYKELGINAAEIPFTYGVWMKNPDAKEIGELAKKSDVLLSIHAPYWINLNSKEKKKIEESKKRILDSCERGHYLNVNYIVFHAGFYGDNNPEECYQTIKKSIIEMQKVIRKNKWKVQLAPETTGKASQFGDIDELLRLRKETKCHLCVDFAHMKARTGKRDYKEIFDRLKKARIKYLHSHFSGIEYTEKGERRHLITPEKEIKELLEWIKKSGIDSTIINESPNPLGDSIKTLKILKKM